MEINTNDSLGIILTRIKDGLFIHVNKTYADFHEYNCNEMIGQSVFSLNTWASNDQRNEVISLLKEHGTISKVPIKARLKDGRIKDCLLTAELIEIDGEKYSLGIVQDYNLFK
jgi:PAS domain S-box-containing protein